jgi:hypothetical protein
MGGIETTRRNGIIAAKDREEQSSRSHVRSLFWRVAMSDDKASVLAEMDAAAREAEKDLATLDQAAVEAIAAWWSKWYLTAGHKRLGRLLVKIAKSSVKKKN